MNELSRADWNEEVASNGVRYMRVSGVDSILPVSRMRHTAHCFKAFEVNPMIGCDHRCSYCSILASTPEQRFFKNTVFDDFPSYLESFIASQAEPWNLTFFFTPQADAFSPIMLESGMTRRILSVFEQSPCRFFLFTKGGHGGRLPDDVWDILRRCASRCQIVFSIGLPAELEAKLEPGAASSDERLTLARRCEEAGIATSGSIAPFLPIYDDMEPYIRRMFTRFRSATVPHVSIELLKVTRAGLEHVIRELPGHEARLRGVFDFQNRMEVNWTLPGGEQTERFFTNREYLASQLRLALAVAEDLDLSLSVCAEVANLAGVQEINRRAAVRGYSCSGVQLRLIQRREAA